MSRAISTPIVLKHNNIVPGSEVITIRGSSIPALIRDVDTGAAIGVFMKAIQELKTEKDTKIAELRARIEALEL